MKLRMRRTLVASAAGVLSLLLVGTASATPTVPWGFNEDWGWTRDASNLQVAQWTSAEAARQVGSAAAIQPDDLSADRFSVQWAVVERKKGTYDWKETNGVYAAMKGNSVRPVMVLSNAPAWARDPKAQCPADPNPCAYPPLPKYDGQWKKFVRAAIAKYPEVRAIEVWSEPNIGRFWAPAPDPQRYSAILRAAHDAAAAQRSPTPVVTGGLAPAVNSATTMGAAQYLKQVYALAGAGSFEGIGTHPYIGTNPRTTDPTQDPLVASMQRRLDNLREVRDDPTIGDSATPLWITEIGLSSDGSIVASDGTPLVTLENQGDQLANLYRSIEGQDVAVFIIHRFHDIRYESGYWNQTGVVYEDLTAKPAYCQLGTQIGTPCGG